ncbi:hypothetical protein ACTMU2_11030 [Cupriavidus basilensis]
MPLLQPDPCGAHPLCHATLIPETGQRCEVERIVEHLALQRRQRARFPERVHAVQVFRRWKRPIARSFFQGSTLTFGRQRGAVPADAQAVAVWESKGCGQRNGTEAGDSRGGWIPALRGTGRGTGTADFLGAGSGRYLP